MGVFKDVVDTIKDVDWKGLAANSLKNKKYSSIAKRSDEGILQFQVVVSNAIDVETLQMVNKALERNYATFVMVAISMSPTMDISKTDDISDYLHKFHQNTNTRRDKYDMLNTLTPYIEAYQCYNSDDNERLIFFGTYENCASRGVLESLRFDNAGSYMAGLNDKILNDIVVEGKSGKGDRYKDHRRDGSGNSMRPDKDDSLSGSLSDGGMDSFLGVNLAGINGGTADLNTPPSTSASHTAKPSTRPSAPLPPKPGYNNTITHAGGHKDSVVYKGSAEVIHKHQGTANQVVTNNGEITLKMNQPRQLPNEDLSKGMLTQQDIQKANEIVPTMLHIRLKMVSKVKDGGYADAGYTDFMLGVKAHMHLVQHQEMMTHMLNGLRHKGNFFNFIRCTTGEISFVKDFLLNTKEIKDDIADRSAGADAFWLSSKRRKAMSKIKEKSLLGNQILPNSTIVISMDEVEFIKAEYGFDLMNEAVVRKLFDEYFMLGFVVVDSSTQMVHFLFESRQQYEAVTFSGLERENSNDAKKFKEMLKAINRN